MNYLASPPLCVAYALSGRMDVDLLTDPLQDDVHLSDIWPSRQEIQAEIERAVESDTFRKEQRGLRGRRELGPPSTSPRATATPPGTPPTSSSRRTSPSSRRAPRSRRAPVAVLGDSVTTDHISLAGATSDLPAGRYLIEHGVDHKDFNFELRRGNHEVIRADRQRAAAQPAGAGHRGRFHDQGRSGSPRSSRRQRSTTTRRCACWQAWRRKRRLVVDRRLGGPRLLGVRFVIVESVRAHPPLEPRNGRSACSSSRGRVRGVARADGRGDVRPRAARGGRRRSR